MPFSCKSLLLTAALALCSLTFQAQTTQPQAQRPNVILFVADGLRRGSVTAEDMPAFYKLRSEGTDFRNSHAVFPTFTTANASAIATGHGLGDTGDYGNFIYPGLWLAKPELAPATGSIAPFLENDDVIASMNHLFGGNYLHERTLLSVAREAGYNVASVGKLGPTAIQQNESVSWDPQGFLAGIQGSGAIIVDDSTGKPNGVELPPDITEALEKAHLVADAPLRSNGYNDTSAGNNNFSGDAITPGTVLPNAVQQQWFADVSTKVLLPRFAADAGKPFVFLFWSRDPDGTEHNEGDSLQQLTPGINGDIAKLGLHNADRCLKQLLDWLDAHPAIKANTDIVVTSDHGFATITRREIDAKGGTTAEVSANLTYEPNAKDKPEPPGTLPQGFLAIDLAVRGHMRLYDPAVRAMTGSSVYSELLLNGEKAHYPSTGSALLGDVIRNVDGSDAQLIVTANGGTDLVYVPSKNPQVVRNALAVLTQLDYVGSLFVDDTYCAAPTDCPGALRMSEVGMVGTSPVPRPAIVVAFKTFYLTPGDLQSGVIFSDYPLQEGQGMHGGFGRDQTWNNMAAIGPDFKKGWVDEEPTGNVDIVPTLAKLLGLSMPNNGKLQGRALDEALNKGQTHLKGNVKTVASAPTSDGMTTVLEFEEQDGVRYNNRACLVSASKDGASPSCP